ncbi:MAG: elongation factor G [Planctomycetota bacterium]|nr:elongation factor G [Planctomycetota bacterium]
MAHDPDEIRNVAFVGAGGAGKTTLCEALLHHCKVTSRRGRVEDGNTVTDWDEDERDRQQSILATPVHLPWDGHRINLIDTPGALDFIGESICALAAVETAVICVSAHDGVGVATRRIFRSARDQGLACVVLITRVETENVDSDALYAGIQGALGERAVPINLPNAFGSKSSGVVDIFASEIPADLQEQAAMFRQQATDRVVECDDDLLASYFETGKVSQEDLAAAFPRALRQGNIVPVLHVSVDRGVGMRKLLDFITHDCPGPSTRAGKALRKAVDAEGRTLDVATDSPFSAQVWKLQVDPHVGRVAFLRVWSGSLASKTHLVVNRTGETERIGDVLEVQGKEMHPVSSASYGDIVAVAKVEDLHIGDTVSDGSTSWNYIPIPVPVPKVTLAIEPKNRNDEAKIGPELMKLADADAAFVAEREQATGELVVRGMSTLHLDVMLKRLGRRRVEAVTHAPRIPYLETVQARGEAMFRHKKQSGGKGQFAEVHLKVEPVARGTGFEFADEVVGGTIPRQFIPAVEKGVRETCAHGVVAGYPFVDVRAIVHFGKYHDVDSDEHSFKLAASSAFRLAVKAARPVLLEPVMHVTIEVPSRFMGDISGDLNTRRGRIQGMNQEGDTAIIEAEVPLSEMMHYSTELRSLTAGEGDFEFRLDHYDVVPAHVAGDIIAKHEKTMAHA